MNDAPVEIRIHLPEWRFFVARLDRTKTSDVPEALTRLMAETAERIRQRFSSTADLSKDPVVQAVRHGFRRAGTDPTRHRPSFEALARRVLKGNALPRIHPIVDACNLLSLSLHVPVCLVDLDRVEPPFHLDRGDPGETFASLKGPYSAEGKPTLRDRVGIVGTPIVDSERTRITSHTERALLYAYLPLGVTLPCDPAATLEDILQGSGAARLVDWWFVEPEG